MPSADLLLFFQRDLKLETQWWVSGQQYSKTCEVNNPFKGDVSVLTTSRTGSQKWWLVRMRYGLIYKKRMERKMQRCGSIDGKFSIWHVRNCLHTMVEIPGEYPIICLKSLVQYSLAPYISPLEF